MPTINEVQSEPVEPWVDDYIPSILPPTWVMIERVMDGAKYANTFLNLVVILSGRTEQDGRRWLHLSVSHRGRLPTWKELVEVKELFLGEEKYAYQIIPPRSMYVNINPNVLHLFHCVDENPLPDFTNGSGSL